MARPKEFEKRTYLGASVSPAMVNYIQSIRHATGIGTAEFLRRLVQAEMTRQQKSMACGAVAVEAKVTGNCNALSQKKEAA